MMEIILNLMDVTTVDFNVQSNVQHVIVQLLFLVLTFVEMDTQQVLRNVMMETTSNMMGVMNVKQNAKFNAQNA